MLKSPVNQIIPFIVSFNDKSNCIEQYQSVICCYKAIGEEPIMISFARTVSQFALRIKGMLTDEILFARNQE